jgi:hypothetical protein
MTPEPTQVLFIVGKGRSGTTLLGNLLGQAEGFASVGELWRLWQDDPATTVCGCGDVLTECRLWSEVVDRLGITAELRGEMRKHQRRVMTWPAVPAMLWRGLRGPRFRNSLAAYAATMEAVYRTVAEVMEVEVVVDSSKWPLDPGLVAATEGVEGHGVHLVRDPRAVAHSWRRRKRYPEGREMPRFSPLYSALSWSARNMLAERSRHRVGSRWLRLRYEDLVEDPGTALAAVRGLVGSLSESQRPPTVEPVSLKPTHTVAGNPDRMTTGPIEIRGDDAWRTESGLVADAVVTAVCFPWMLRYGYPLRRPRRA